MNPHDIYIEPVGQLKRHRIVKREKLNDLIERPVYWTGDAWGIDEKNAMLFYNFQDAANALCVIQSVKR
jgi:hypothetical protein